MSVNLPISIGLHAGISNTGHAPRSEIGEILLLVDVPRWRLSEVERGLRTRHPEVEIGGVGWGWDGLGI